MKATLEICERLVYTRNVDVELPDGMSEDGFESCIESADRSMAMTAEEYVDHLRQFGISLIGDIDRSLDSPDDAEVECDSFDVEQDA